MRESQYLFICSMMLVDIYFAKLASCSNETENQFIRINFNVLYNDHSYVSDKVV